MSAETLTNCFQPISHTIYSVYEQAWESCSTDTKIYTLFILGRVLQTAACLSCVAAVASAWAFGPAALLATVPALALGFFGTQLAENAEPLALTPLIERPYVEGQPIGLVNNGNNCWLTASLQLLAHVPAFAARIRAFPEFAQFLDAYRQDQADCNKISSSINPFAMRQMLHRATNGGIDSGYRQEDAAQVFEYLFQGDRSLYQFEQALNGYQSCPCREPMIALSLESIMPPFETLLSRYFDHLTDRGVRKQLFFSQPPQDLLIQFKRFNRSSTGVESKICTAIDTPEQFALSPNHTLSNENAIYYCDAFLVHNGTTLKGGHYIAFIQIDNVWWRCSDTSVVEVSTATAEAARQQSYIIHYRKV